MCMYDSQSTGSHCDVSEDDRSDLPHESVKFICDFRAYVMLTHFPYFLAFFSCSLVRYAYTSYIMALCLHNGSVS